MVGVVDSFKETGLRKLPREGDWSPTWSEGQKPLRYLEEEQCGQGLVAGLGLACC